MIEHTETPDFPRRAVLCGVQLPDVSDTEFRESLEELGRLAKTLGLLVAPDVITQRRSSFDSGAYLGPGRLADLTALVNVDPEHTAVLVDHEISPSQARNMEKATDAAAVLDRTAVILEIFHRHAKSRQARLQVEIVRLMYMAPRLREASKGGDRQRGGIGGKGAGEAEIELDRRKIRDRVAELRRELLSISTERVTQRARRQGLRRVALCGYTNAGKSTLFRALTGSEVYIADKLFATLDTTVRSLHPESRPKVLMSDTIGFIRNLPTNLVESFKSTLDEALEASLILHVVDSADPAWERHMQTTSAVLTEIGAGDVPQLVVLNKIDKRDGSGLPLPPLSEVTARLLPPGGGAPDVDPTLAGPDARDPARPVDVLAISARDPGDVARVRQAILDFFERELLEVEVLLPYDRQALRAEIFGAAQVLEERFDEAGAHLRVRADAATLDSLRKRLGTAAPDDKQDDKEEIT